jgi:mRNA interferase HigB
MFNIITRRTLLRYCNLYPSAANALKEWYNEMATANLNNFNELKMIYPNASVIGDNRIVFNILGNHFRLIVRIMFEYKAIQIKWFGTHSEYDRIDAKTIQYK